jgi:hypothetical protein
MTKPRQTEAATACRADRQQFLAEGYVVVKDAIDTALLTTINREIAELFTIQLRRLQLSVDAGDSREAFTKQCRAAAPSRCADLYLHRAPGAEFAVSPPAPDQRYDHRGWPGIWGSSCR